MVDKRLQYINKALKLVMDIVEIEEFSATLGCPIFLKA